MFGHFMNGVFGGVVSGNYMPITSANGDFTVGETVTGGTSAKTATVVVSDSERNYLLVSSPSGDFTDGAIIGEGAASTGIVIKDNLIYNSDTTAGFVIDLNVACTGLLVKNNCGTLYATDPETTLDPGSLLCIENYVCNAVDESGALVPTTVST